MSNIISKINLIDLSGFSKVDDIFKSNIVRVNDVEMPSFPVGAIIPFSVSTVPLGFLECNGQLILKVNYPSLYSFLKDGGGYSIYGESGNSFYLPDYRGYFLRTWDHGAGRDPYSASRTNRGDGTPGDNVGTKQPTGLKFHQHLIMLGSTPAHHESSFDNSDLTDGDHYPSVPRKYTTNTGGNETRPKNINVMYCIKY